MSVSKKFFTLAVVALSVLISLSWGVTGHRTVADIADRHLTARAKAAVHDLLGDLSLADVSTWADEIRDDPTYRNTGREHYINLPLGLSHPDFDRTVREMSTPNVYSALLKNEKVLESIESTKEEKQTALKFIVHFIGDLHQPMHVSRAEDKGGNTIQVRYDGNGTNLHALWDSKLLEHGGMNDRQLAEKYDHLTQAQINQWQKDPLIEWVWESYQISSELYADEEKPGGNMITDSYYQKYMPVIQHRIQQAGIRLAGVLNTIFKNGLPASGAATASTGTAQSGASGTAQPGASGTTQPGGAASTQTNSGDSYCEMVYDGKYFEGSGMTLLNLGAAYPNQTMTVVIYNKDREKWSEDPIKLYKGKKICVTGRHTEFKGKPEIIVNDPGQVKIE